MIEDQLIIDAVKSRINYITMSPGQTTALELTELTTLVQRLNRKPDACGGTVNIVNKKENK